MTNNVFRRALISLSHPVSIAAIVVVLLNDHWWRRVVPSWFTGKVGDFAWLIFAPFLLALLLAWLVPKREKLVGHIAIMGVGLTFGLAKTIPAFHTLTIGVLEFLTGWPNILRIDPTDLIALPALLLAWWIWERSAARSIRLPDRGWVLLPLAMLATMADSPAPNYGIACFEEKGGQIFASDAYAAYTSLDGGLTWNESTAQPQNRFCDMRAREVVSPNNPGLRFRYDTAGVIERSEDGGQTWRREYAVAPMSQAQSAYVEQGSYAAVLRAGPLNALIDARTGNAIFALGHQGVLVRTPAGEWRAVEVGPYHAIDLQQPDKIMALLSGEVLLALVLMALAVATIAPLARQVQFRSVAILSAVLTGIALVVIGVVVTTGNFLAVLLALIGMPPILLIYARRGGRGVTLTNTALAVGWVAWLTTLFITPPALVTGYLRPVSVLGVIAAAIFGVPVAIKMLIGTFRIDPKAAWLTIGLSVLTALLFLAPFVVWTQDGIPYYYTAAIYAGVLVAVMCFVGHRHLQRQVATSKNLTTA